MSDGRRGERSEGESRSVVSDSLQAPEILHGILQARIVEWVAIPFSRGPSQPGLKPWFPTLQADSLAAETPGKPKILEWVAYPFFSRFS